MHFIAIIKLSLLLGDIVPPNSWMVELSEGLDPQIGYLFALGAEIPYRRHATTQIWMVLLIGQATRKICFNQSEALLRSG